MIDLNEKFIINDSFKKLVEKCRQTESTQIIHNASFEHAKVLFKNLFQIARENNERIRITTGVLRDDFYGELVDDLKACLEKKVEVEVLVLEPKCNLKSSSFATALKKYGGKLSQLTKSVKGTPHFIVVGEKRFRFEQDHDNTTAIASFNNPQIGAMLNNIFIELKHGLS